MKKMFVFLMSALLVLFCVAAPAYSSVKYSKHAKHAKHSKLTHWGYYGKNGPFYWGELSGKFFQCKTGKNQTPINISGYVSAKLKPISFYYNANAAEILNNGHTIKVNYHRRAVVVIDNTRFELKQFHFHSPSENRIDDESFPMEAHFVHADRHGNLAVVAVMYKVKDEANYGIEKLWSQMPKKTGDKYRLNSVVNAMELMPRDKSYYRFTGSLTTPPCSEGVYWIVLKTPVSISRKQLRQFVRVMEPNNRPIMPLNSRVILSSP